MSRGPARPSRALQRLFQRQALSHIVQKPATREHSLERRLRALAVDFSQVVHHEELQLDVL